MSDQGDDYEDEAPPYASPSRRGPLIAFGSAGLVVVAALIWGVVNAGLWPGRDEPGAAAVSVSGPSSATLAATTAPTTAPPPPSIAADQAALAFLTAWDGGEYDLMQSLVVNQGDDVAGAYARMAERLGVTDVTVVPGLIDQATLSVPYEVTLTLGGLGDVGWSGFVAVAPDTAAVAWTAATLYPGLLPGQWLDLVPLPSRAELVDVSGQPLSGSADLTQNLVGTVDPATGTGASGLQRALDAQLAGPAASRVVVADALNGQVVTTVKDFPGAAPAAPVATTIDLRVQSAAESALAAAPGRSALVALRPSTGGVLAVANHPVEGLPVALTGAYPPGSTFKIVTATALLRNGLSPGSEVQCPDTVSAGGRRFGNSSGVPTGAMSLLTAFAVSCNTAFIEQAGALPGDALADAAASFGFGGGQPLPVGSVGGTFPPPPGAVDAAAAAIGQGQVTASPLQMASVAAAVATGVWRQPRLAACPDCDQRTVREAGELQPMMREAVVSGTGSAAAGVPGGPVYGKTGSAEASSGTHAWFVGWQGDLAFAVFVENGGSGSKAAAPLAAAFVTALASG